MGSKRHSDVKFKGLNDKILDTECVNEDKPKENAPKEPDVHYVSQFIETEVAKVLKRVFGDEVIDKLLGATDEQESVDQTELQTDDTPSQQPSKRKPIRKISESLNVNLDGLTVFSDTREIVPGTVVYVIDKVSPSDTVPYMTYKPAPRIVTEVQDNGVNNGTVFLTYEPKVVSVGTYHLQQHNKPQVISERDVIYSPLTKEHAKYICKLLNVQSKQMYMAALKQTTHTK